jgi:hypothetical protein
VTDNNQQPLDDTSTEQLKERLVAALTRAS